MDRRLIEETFPVKEVSKESSKEKSIRQGHISTLHTWWARRPLLASRAVCFASLIQFSSNKKKNDEHVEFIKKLSVWHMPDYDHTISKARKMVLNANNSKPFKVLDPFAGGGSIPLEALRLGCETYASEYNPVANIVLKGTLEFVQKFSGIKLNDFKNIEENNFINDIKSWKTWLVDKTKKELTEFYGDDKNEVIVGYIWVRVIKCSNPTCKSEIPLTKSFYVSKKSNSTIAILPVIKNKKISFKLVTKEKSEFPKKFDPSIGTIQANSNCQCLSCKMINKPQQLKEKLFNKEFESRILCVITKKNNRKDFRLPTEKDLKCYSNSVKFLTKLRDESVNKYGVDLVPEQFIQTPTNQEYIPGNPYWNFTGVLLYDITKWQDLFNSRQLLINVMLIENIKKAKTLMAKQKIDEEYANAILTYLAMLVDKVMVYNTKLCVWAADGHFVSNTFGRQALPMKWDFVEVNPFSESTGSLESAFNWMEMVLEHLSLTSNIPAKVDQQSALSLSYENEFFDAIFTDPPYYDMIPYSILSDFFYVWLKKSLGSIYPNLFSPLLTNKQDEAIAETPLLRGMSKINASESIPDIKTKAKFEKMLSLSFQEFYRVLKNNGIAVIVYAHKSTDGWETVINSILNSGLIVTAVWPISTERPGRPSSQNSAVLSSSIYIVCRKWKKEPHESYNNVKKQMQEYLDKKLDFLWTQDIRGADFFISAIGSAIEVFGKYEKITDNADNEIKVPQLLEDVRKIVSEHTIRKVLRGDIGGEISTMTRFYVLWRSAYGQAKVPYDDARKLATSLGIPNDELNKGFIKQVKESSQVVVRVIGPENRSADEIKEPTELIDVLHKVLILWRNNKKEEYEKLLTETGYANNDTFKRVAQAIRESLPDEIQEKKWLDGFLPGFTESGKTDGKQTKLFE